MRTWTPWQLDPLRTLCQAARVEFRAIFLVAVGLVALLWPDRIASRAKRQYERRLAELQSGAEESYFEEKRSMLAYPPRHLWRWTRECGLLLAALGLADLFFFR